MTNKVLVALLFCLTSTISNAQSSSGFVTVPKIINCATSKTVLSALVSKEINESPIWMGTDESEKSEFILFVNPETSAFTLVQTTSNVACILGIGLKSTDIPKPPLKGKPL